VCAASFCTQMCFSGGVNRMLDDASFCSTRAFDAVRYWLEAGCCRYLRGSCNVVSVCAGVCFALGHINMN
jgi:hypothetical protein